MPIARLTLDANWDGRITIAALTERLFEKGAGKQNLVALPQDTDPELVEQLCGPWCHPLENTRDERKGAKTRAQGTWWPSRALGASG